MPDDKLSDPDSQVSELTAKVNSLLEELAKERIARVRAEKVNSIAKQWTDFKDDGQLDLATVEWMLSNYKPATAKTNGLPPTPTQPSTPATVRTPDGKPLGDKPLAKRVGFNDDTGGSF